MCTTKAINCPMGILGESETIYQETLERCGNICGKRFFSCGKSKGHEGNNESYYLGVDIKSQDYKKSLAIWTNNKNLDRMD